MSKKEWTADSNGPVVLIWAGERVMRTFTLDDLHCFLFELVEAYSEAVQFELKRLRGE